MSKSPCVVARSSEADRVSTSTETVLFTLLSSFKLELAAAGSEAIVWNVGGVIFPSMGHGNGPAMMLKVSLLNNDDT